MLETRSTARRGLDRATISVCSVTCVDVSGVASPLRVIDVGLGRVRVDRSVALTPTTMKVLPRADRRAIMRSVQRGRQVDDPAYAAIAIEYATRLVSVYRWVTILWALSAAANLITAVLDPTLLRIALPLLGLLAAAASLYGGRRIQRSIQRNQALVDRART
jgi:hypothetical protein